MRERWLPISHTKMLIPEHKLHCFDKMHAVLTIEYVNSGSANCGNKHHYALILHVKILSLIKLDYNWVQSNFCPMMRLRAFDFVWSKNLATLLERLRGFLTTFYVISWINKSPQKNFTTLVTLKSFDCTKHVETKI